MKTIYFVCHNNCDLSVMAEKICEKKMVLNKKFIVQSRGLLVCDGSFVYPEIKNVLNKHGIKIGKRKAKQLSDYDIKNAEMIIVFENNQKNAFLDFSNIYSLDELTGCGDFALKEETNYETMFNQIYGLMPQLIEKIQLKIFGGVDDCSCK